MKKILAAITAALLGLGVGASAVALPAFATNLPTDATAVASSASGPTANNPDYWETAAGEVCTKDDSVDSPYTLVAPPAGYAYSKLIIKAGSAGSSVTYENYVWYPPNIIVGAQYRHQEKNSISHLILCVVPVDQPVTITVEPSVIDPTCDEDGSLVVPVTAHVTWTGGTDGAGPGSYTLVAHAEDGYYISGTSSFPRTVLGQLTGEECDKDQPVTITVEPSVIDPTCDEDGSLVVPVTAHVTWTGGTDGAGPGSYTLVAHAEDGYYISGTSSFPRTVLGQLTGEECDEDQPVTITVEPSVIDPTCDEDGSLVVPVTAHVTWTGGTDGAGPGSYTLVAHAEDGYYISGTSSFPRTVLGQLDVEECLSDASVVGDPTPTDAQCADDETDTPMQNGYYTIHEAEGVGYRVYVDDVLDTTINSDSPYGAIQFFVTSYPSTVKIVAFALPGYVLNPDAEDTWEHTFLFSERLCNLQDFALVTPVVDQDPASCTLSGRFFLGGEGVEWLTSPGGLPVAAGWHNVPAATTLTFQAVPSAGNGFAIDTQTTFVFEFDDAPLECLDTLAFTGNEGVPLFLGGAAALLLLGAASIFFTRKRTI